jgi:hypothetical protein
MTDKGDAFVVWLTHARPIITKTGKELSKGLPQAYMVKMARESLAQTKGKRHAWQLHGSADNARLMALAIWACLDVLAFWKGQQIVAWPGRGLPLQGRG